METNMSEKSYIEAKFNGASNSYTYRVHFQVEPGDFVVVETPSNGYQVVEVTRAGDFEPEYKGPIRLAVCRVNLAEYKRLAKGKKQL